MFGNRPLTLYYNFQSIQIRLFPCKIVWFRRDKTSKYVSTAKEWVVAIQSTRSTKCQHRRILRVSVLNCCILTYLLLTLDTFFRTNQIHDVWQFGIVLFVCLTGCLVTWFCSENLFISCSLKTSGCFSHFYSFTPLRTGRLSWTATQ